MSETNAARLRRVETVVKEGRLPRILTPLPGVERLLRAHGLEPGVDIFVPVLGMSQAEMRAERSRIRYRRQYVKGLADKGAYRSRKDRRRDSADELLEALLREQNS